MKIYNLNHKFTIFLQKQNGILEVFFRVKKVPITEKRVSKLKFIRTTYGLLFTYIIFVFLIIVSIPFNQIYISSVTYIFYDIT